MTLFVTRTVLALFLNQLSQPFLSIYAPLQNPLLLLIEILKAFLLLLELKEAQLIHLY